MIHEAAHHEELENAASSQGRVFRLADFEGPLDLLLYLIRKNEMDIYDIHISTITEQFLECLRQDPTADLDELSDFYQMAATLLYIKSRQLLPGTSEEDDEFEDPRRTLIDQLIEYHRFKKLSELMEQREMEVEWFVERACSQRTLPFPETVDDEPWINADAWDLLRTFASMIRHFNSERIIDLYEEVSINDKIILMRDLLQTRGACRFSDLLSGSCTALDLACAFLAVLEAARNRMIRIRQHRLFGDIMILPFSQSESPHG